MQKLAMFVVIILTSAITANIYAQEVKIDFKAESEIIAGDSLLVTFKIYKKDFNGFAEFKQRLPEGYLAYERKSEDANFNFTSGVVCFTWYRMPATNDTLIVSYKILVSQNLKEQAYQIPAYFSYQAVNRRGEIVIPYTLNVLDKNRRVSNTDIPKF